MSRREPTRELTFRGHAGRTGAEAMATLGSSPIGLTAAEAKQRLAANGPNALKASGPKSPLVLLALQFYDPLVGILLFAALASMIAQEWTDAGVVFAIVVISAVLSFVKEWRATVAVEELKSRIAPRATVLRDGESCTCPTEDLVVGDVVVLSAGSRVPADGVVIEAKDFLVDEAVLTGETFPAEKSIGTFERDTPLSGCRSVVFAGTSVRSGSARVGIVSTAKDTVFGAVATHIELRADETDFERGVRHFGRLVSEVMVILVGVVFVLNVVTSKPPIESLLFAIAIAVGMAPELLPAVLTITLSHGARAMAKRGVIVRRLAAIENLGSMDVLCTDKTGTLTEGIVELEAAEAPDGTASDETLRLAFLNSSLETGFSNPLDLAVLAYGKARGLGAPTETKLDEIPYDFVRKRLGIVVESAGARSLVLKGALAKVLETCDRVRTNGGVAALDDTTRTDLLGRADIYATRGLRVLGVARGEVPALPAYDKEHETSLVFEGFLLFSDPPKAGIENTLADLARLGVEVKVITGDSRPAAIHLAERIGLSTKYVLTSAEIASVADEALGPLAERTTIFAEVDPNQKERLILALKKRGHCVGYMGDGINDAPALHMADVGISVEGAVDVARDSADFVLLRRDLDVLRAGIEEGRTTFANTLKYVSMTTSANFGNMLSLAGASVFLPFLPLLAKQVLLNNFLSDVPAMTIARDGVDPELLERPRRWDVAEIRRFMIVFGAISSVFDFACFFYLRHLLHLPPEGFRTAWFVESLLTELVILFVVRTRRPLWKSRPSTTLLVSSLAMGLLAIVIPYTPLDAVFGFVPLAPDVMVGVLLLTVGYGAASEFAKHHFYRAEQKRLRTARPPRKAFRGA